MDSCKGFFLPVFGAPFYDCFQTLIINAFLWMITLFGANSLESSKICQKVETFLIKCPEILENFTLFLKCIYLKKNLLDWRAFIVKIAPNQFKLKCLVFKFPAWQNFKVSYTANKLRNDYVFFFIIFWLQTNVTKNDHFIT